MKKYNVFSLKVVKVSRGNGTYQYFICTYNYLGVEKIYKEIFTGEVINVNDNSFVEPLSNYYSLLGVCDYTNRTKHKPLMLSLKSLLDKYNEINYVNYNLETDEEIIQKELEQRGLFEESKIYRKRTNKLS